jgi:hypothetical protein
VSGASPFTAACLPDEPTAPASVETPVTAPEASTEAPSLPEGTLECGEDGIATDSDPVHGNWAYCEPALAGLEGQTLYPCPVEDAPNCYWDAATMGNGTGRSFVNIDGTYYYAEDTK